MSRRSARAACRRRTLFVVLLAVLLAGGAASGVAKAQPDTTRWTRELSMQYDQITETEISPDGRHVAYVVREAVMDETTSEFRQHIHTVVRTPNGGDYGKRLLRQHYEAHADNPDHPHHR